MSLVVFKGIVESVSAAGQNGNRIKIRETVGTKTQIIEAYKFGSCHFVAGDSVFVQGRINSRPNPNNPQWVNIGIVVDIIGAVEPEGRTATAPQAPAMPPPPQFETEDEAIPF